MDKKELYIKLSKMTDDELESIIDSGLFNDIIEGYTVLLLKQEGLHIDELHNKMVDIFDFHTSKDVKKLVNK